MASVDRIKDNLWMGSLRGPLYTPHVPNLHIHCCYEVKPIESGADQTIWLKLDDDSSFQWRRDKTWVEDVLGVAGEGVRELDQGGTVVVNCYMGLNRSGLITALILMLAYGMSADDAIATIRSRRDSTALNNPRFVEFLREFDRAR